MDVTLFQLTRRKLAIMATCALLAAFNCPAVSATESSAMHVSLSNDAWPPYVMADGSGGLAIEVVSAAFARENVTVELELKPWARALYDVENCNNDLVLAWYVASREDKIRYSNPFLKNRLRFVKRVEDDFRFKGQASLNGKLIGVIRGYNYLADFATDNRYILRPNKSFASNLQMLALGRLDLVLEDEIVASSTMYNLKMTNQFSFTGPPLNERNLYIATGLCNPHADELISHFNHGLEQIKNDGTYDKILAKYGALLQSRSAPLPIRSVLPLTLNEPHIEGRKPLVMLAAPQ